MSNDGPTLNDEAHDGGRPQTGHAHSHGSGPSHSHPLTPGQHAHARGKGVTEPSGKGAGHDFDLPALPDAVDVFDTTLRDGSQQEGISLTVDDKLRVAEQLDHLGVTFIEGGWPGANPKDEEFFRRAAAGELHLHTATLVAFGSTRILGKPSCNLGQ